MAQQQVVKKLSTTKQKLSLGEVKKAEKVNAVSTRKFTRTTVVNPEDLEWPFITDMEEKELIDCISSDLHALRRPSNSAPLNVISKVDKKDRRSCRQAWYRQYVVDAGFNIDDYKKLRKDVLIGANSVSTAMEKDVVKAIIIDKTVDPAVLTKLLIPLARSKEIPIVAIKGLSKTCHEAFQTRCIAMGFKVSCCECTHPFNRLYSMISAIARKDLQVSEAAVSLAQLASNCQTNTKSSDKIVEAVEGSSIKHHYESTQPDVNSSSVLFKPPKIRKV